MKLKPYSVKSVMYSRKFLKDLEKHLKDKVASPKGNNLDTRIQLERLNYLYIVNSDIHEGLKEFGGLLSPVLSAKKISEIKKKYVDKSPKEILDLLAKCELELMAEKGYAAISEKMIAYLTNYVEGVEYARQTNSKNRQTGKATKKSEDDKHRIECLGHALKNVTTVTGYEYPKYFSELKRRYPKPLSVPEPRLTAAEKKLSKAKQAELIAEKKAERDGNWLDQTERAFFKKQTGVGAKSKKASSVK
jgi:hypothetical protein